MNLVTELRIQHGPFSVIQRTDGAFAVIDTRRPVGDRTVALHELSQFMGFFGGKADREEAKKRALEAAEADAKARAALEKDVAS